MELRKNGEVYTRRHVIGAFLGGVAALSQIESASPAPGPETNGGGILCVAPPNEAGILELETIHEDAVDNETFVDQSEIAARFGLTVTPNRLVQEFIDEKLSETRTALEAVEILSEFTLEHFDIPVNLDMVITESESTRTVTFPTVSPSSQAKLLKNLAMIPKEFYEAINLSYIMMEDLPDHIGGDYTLSLNRIRLDPLGVESPDILYHELSHALHLTGCGQFEDQAITNTLPSGVEYTGESDNEAREDGTFVDPYGQKNYKEDFATIGSAWMTGKISLSDEIEGSPLYDKLAIVMDRFDTLVPGMVGYVEEGLRPAFLRKA